MEVGVGRKKSGKEKGEFLREEGRRTGAVCDNQCDWHGLHLKNEYGKNEQSHGTSLKHDHVVGTRARGKDPRKHDLAPSMSLSLKISANRLELKRRRARECIYQAHHVEAHGTLVPGPCLP